MSIFDELEKDMLKQEILNKDLVIDNLKKENAELNSYIEYLKEDSKGHFDQVMRNGLEATELRAKLEKAQKRLSWLDALEEAGVDNWEGISYAYELLQELGCE